jgi:hypothetical protein
MAHMVEHLSSLHETWVQSQVLQKQPQKSKILFDFQFWNNFTYRNIAKKIVQMILYAFFFFTFKFFILKWFKTHKKLQK